MNIKITLNYNKTKITKQQAYINRFPFPKIILSNIRRFPCNKVCSCNYHFNKTWLSITDVKKHRVSIEHNFYNNNKKQKQNKTKLIQIFLEIVRRKFKSRNFTNFNQCVVSTSVFQSVNIVTDIINHFLIYQYLTKQFFLCLT